MSFTREDNYIRHFRRHQSHHQEIFACNPTDDYKGVHLQNPIAVEPDTFNIKPYRNIAIHPVALNLWRWQEGQRRRGIALPKGGDCDRYFDAHPEEAEAALRGDPEWDWAMPPAGHEFRPIDSRCMEGTFKLDIKPSTTS